MQQQSQPPLKRQTYGQDSHKETLTSKTRNVVISGDRIPRGKNRRLLNTDLIKSKAIKNVFHSGLTITNYLHLDFIKAVNKSLKLDHEKYGYNIIENSNMLPTNLWQDGLHLNNSGKGKLLNKFLVSLNQNYFLSKSFIL